MLKFLIDALLWPLRLSFGGGGSGSNVSKFEPQDYAKPYLAAAAEQQAQLSARPYTPYEGQRIAGLNTFQTQGLQNIADMVATSTPNVNAAQSNLLQTLSGGFQNPYSTMQTSIAENPYASAENPYVAQAIQSGQQRLADRYSNTVAPNTNAMAALSRNFGGTAHQNLINQNQQQLVDAMSGVETQYGLPAYQQAAQLTESAINRGTQAQQADLMRGYGGWEAERGRQMQAIPQAWGDFFSGLNANQQMVGVGDVYQGQEQQYLNEQAAEWARAQSYPQQMLDNLLNTAIRSTGGYGTNNTTASTSFNPLASLFGGGLLAGGLLGGGGS